MVEQFIVDFRINETLQIGRRCFQLRHSNRPQYLPGGESVPLFFASTIVGSGNSIFVKEANDTSAVFYNPDNYLVDCRLSYANLSDDIFLFLNSAIGAMFCEIYNRAGLGEGARSMMVSDYEQVPVIANLGSNQKTAALESICPLRPRKLVNSQTEWATLDEIIFDALNLTQGERTGVYEGVTHLVKARLQKAQSLRGN